MTRPFSAFLTIVVFLGCAYGAAAQTPADGEWLCDTQYQNCRDPLVQLIRNETQKIDVAFWFMEDGRYVQELANRQAAGVQIRILVDQRANATKRLNATILAMMRDKGLWMREKYVGDILHFKMMLFHGQRKLEFSKANYTDPEFVPITANVNFSDEAVFFTDDTNLFNSFLRRFDDLWTNTSSFRNLANDRGRPLIRECPTCTIHSSMNFPPIQDFSNRSVSRYNLETQQIDAVVFRVTDARHADAMISAVRRGVRVRLISEPTEYRNPERLWDAKHIDRMYVGGVQIKMRKHAGLMHQASVVLHGRGEVIFGSSNWTTASAAYQDEHNYFYNPSLNKPWFLQWFKDQFNLKWNNTNNFENFVPLPPSNPTYYAPQNGATGLGVNVTLSWDGGPWAHFYDIYLGTDSTNLQRVAQNLEVGSPEAGRRESFTFTNLAPGTRYWWRVVSKTWAQKINNGETWSFTVGGTPSGGGGSTPYTGTPYGGTAATLPGIVQAENFDSGGQGVAYNDTSSGNSGGVYRPTTNVDIGSDSDPTNNGFHVGWTRVGEWVSYTVNATQARAYTVSVRVANVGTGARFRLLVDGVDRSGAIALPNTGSWTTFQTVNVGSISLAQGRRIIRLEMLSQNGSNNGVGNYAYLNFQ